MIKKEIIKKSKRVKKPTIDEAKLPLNPFATKLEIPVSTTNFKGQYKIVDGIHVPVIVEMEITKFFKVYSEASHRKILNHCYPCSKELLLWIMYTVTPARDYIWIDKKRYMGECEVSLNTYKKSILQLTRYGLIVPTGLYKNTYWINPEFFFKGSRVNKYPQKIKEFIAKNPRNHKLNKYSTNGVEVKENK